MSFLGCEEENTIKVSAVTVTSCVTNFIMLKRDGKELS